MALEQHISLAHHWFLDTDKVVRFTVYADDERTTVKDVTGWSFDWVLRRRDDTADPPVLQKSTGAGIAIVGVFNANPATNTQRVEVTIDDVDTDALPPGKYRHSLKRTNPGSEEILSFGDAYLQRATAR